MALEVVQEGEGGAARGDEADDVVDEGLVEVDGSPSGVVHDEGADHDVAGEVGGRNQKVNAKPAKSSTKN